MITISEKKKRKFIKRRGRGGNECNGVSWRSNASIICHVFWLAIKSVRCFDLWIRKGRKTSLRKNHLFRCYNLQIYNVNVLPSTIKQSKYSYTIIRNKEIFLMLKIYIQSNRSQFLSSQVESNILHKWYNVWQI